MPTQVDDEPVEETVATEPNATQVVRSGQMELRSVGDRSFPEQLRRNNTRNVMKYTLYFTRKVHKAGIGVKARFFREQVKNDI